MVDNVTPFVPRKRRVEPPAVLRKLPGWLIWRLMQARVEGAKPRKVPYWADGGAREGANGGAEDRALLVVYDTALAAMGRRGFTGIGFALLPDWGVTAMDFDDCVDERGNVAPEVASICSQTYSEVSPSGTGRRAFVFGNFGNHKAKTVRDADGKVIEYGFEVFSTKGYVTVTGDITPECDMLGKGDVVSSDPKLLAEIKALCERKFGRDNLKPVDMEDPFLGKKPRLGWDEDKVREVVDSKWLDPNMSRAEWIKVGGAIYHESMGEDWGFDIWFDWSQEASEAGKASTREQMEQDWRSFANRDGSASSQSTMATVLWMAKRGGYERDQHAPVDPAKLKAAYERHLPIVTPETVAGKAGPWSIVAFDDAHELVEDEWYIDGLIPMNAAVGVVFGPPGSGKSFFTVDMALAIARGHQWRGRDVERGRVLYIAAEGEGGVPKRLRAYEMHHKLAPGEAAMGVLYGAPNLYEEADITSLAEAIGSAGGVKVIVVDTLAQTTPGVNENSGEDMSVVIANCKELARITGALVLLVHHLGKDANRGMRGWSGLQAAVDFAIEVGRVEESTLRFARVIKMKDDSDIERIGFRLHVVEVGKNKKGRPITSCVVVEAEAPTSVRPEKPSRNVVRYTAWEKIVLEVAEFAYAGVPDASYDDFMKDCVDMCEAPDVGKRDVRALNIKSAIAALSKRANGPLQVDRGRVTFTTE